MVGVPSYQELTASDFWPFSFCPLLAPLIYARTGGFGEDANVRFSRKRTLKLQKLSEIRVRFRPEAEIR